MPNSVMCDLAHISASSKSASLPLPLEWVPPLSYLPRLPHLPHLPHLLTYHPCLTCLAYLTYHTCFTCLNRLTLSQGHEAYNDLMDENVPHLNVSYHESTTLTFDGNK